MPYIALKRRKFGNAYVEVGGEVPLIEGRQYQRLERLGLIRWQNEAVTAPAPKPSTSQAPAGGPEIEIPADWRELPWTPREKGGVSLRTLAGNFGDGTVANKDDAITRIEAELQRRGTVNSSASTDTPEIEIPADWRELDDVARAKLAKDLTGEEFAGVEDADVAIELELEKRNGKSA